MLIKETYTLRNGVKLPKVGFGTWQIPPGEQTFEAVKDALSVGYRHIDTAEGYQNERSVGEAIRASKIPREEIFVTSKLESHIKTYDGALAAFDKTLDELGFDYLDLFLIHAPWPWSEIGKDCREGNVQAYKAMEKRHREGKIRAIGVSNFSPDDIANIIEHADIVPHVNQIGYFIGLDQRETIEFCNDKGIFIEAYSPLGIGYLLKNETVNEIARKNNVSAAQVALRWLLDKGVAPLPKSVHKKRMVENAALDFTLSKEDTAVLDGVKGDPRRWQ
jgi:diketogulonate reductase-like aldo/keto reductase